MKFLTLDDVDVKNKTIFVRADLNCPVGDGKKPETSARLIAHAKTILSLMQKGAKVVILAHQGRKGKEDFISLAPHAKLLETEINKLAGAKKGKSAAAAGGKNKIKVNFIDDVAGERAQMAIKKLPSGEALLLENVRFLDDEAEFEKTGKSALVRNLSPLCDIFVLDAFSVAHRAQASVVGFTKCPAIAGPVMAGELEALLSFENPKRPAVFALGGAKPADSLPIASAWLERGKVDYVLCGGVLSQLMLIASGVDIGNTEFLQKSGSLDALSDAKSLLLKYKKKLILPQDVIVDAKGKAQNIAVLSLPSQFAIMDIGERTAENFSSIIEKAGSIVLNGPMGVYEKEEFSKGTKNILSAIANSSAYSILGGGHTLSAIEKFHILASKFSYVSLSGKALIEFLSGQELPGIKLLENSAKNTTR